MLKGILLISALIALLHGADAIDLAVHHFIDDVSALVSTRTVL